MEYYYQTMPLNDTELNYLLHIYRQKMKRLLPTFLIPLLLILLFNIRLATWIAGKDDIAGVLKITMVSFLFIGGPIIVIALILYFRRILPFKKDADNGIKELIPYVIRQKEYFQFTYKFFFRIDDPQNLHYEVDEETFLKYREGDTIYVSRAPRSKYTFEYGGRFSLL